MLISFNWLKRHVDLAGLDAQAVASALTTHTAEVEGVEPFNPWLGDVVVGHVVGREKHPDADKLSLCKVDIGKGEPLQIVCGAPNVRQGLKVAVAQVGVRLPTGDEGALVKLKKGKIRGQASEGMICSVRELKLGDDHDGIWELPEDTAIGLPVGEAIGLDDWVIEIDNKSLTHRPDLWGHRGIAGELAALFERELKPLDLSFPETAAGEAYPVRVESEGCSRYIGLPIDGVKNGPAPEWMRHLLLAIDQRPIDLLVDLSNFVMFDIGQPNHLFDRDRLSPEGINVRVGRPGEVVQTLDEIDRTVGTEDILICSADTPVAVAGVMGAEASKVTADTTRLLLEAAAFHPTIVRRTSARLGLRSDASTRFEKSLDPTLPAKACAHLVNVLRSIQPDISLPQPAGDAGDWSDPATTVQVRPARVRHVLGAPEIDDAQIEKTLVSLGFGVTQEGEAWTISVPSARSTKDVGIEEDLIEEVGRVHGFDNIAERKLVATIEPPPFDARRMLVRSLQDRLAGAACFHEAMTHSFQSDDLLGRLGLADELHVAAVNPVVEGYSKVRRSVLPSLLGLLENNRRQREDVRLFEVGKGYLPEHKNERGEPREVHELALVWAAPRAAKEGLVGTSIYARLQGIVEDLHRVAGVVAPSWSRSAGDLPAWVHPGKCAVATPGGGNEVTALIGELEPGLRAVLGLEGELASEVVLARISIDALLTAPAAPPAYVPLPKFPSVKVDVALLLPEEMPAAEVETLILQSGKNLVAGLELFDLYRGERLGAGKKSLAYHVVLQARDKTLSDKETAKFLGRLERAAERLGAELRKE
ncbi:MAG: phenylalanyl-tRNA synthetase beta chain [Planctomycetota bacterium]|jgi:phenylalanyl-tRNA synthetase beta chain